MCQLFLQLIWMGFSKQKGGGNGRGQAGCEGHPCPTQPKRPVLGPFSLGAAPSVKKASHPKRCKKS